MERMTYNFNGCWQVHGADNLECSEVCEINANINGCKNCPIAKAFDRLAAYENTGLEPEEIENIKQDVEAGFLKQDARRYGIQVDRLLELSEADRDGRCVVLPPDDYAWTIRGDIVRGIIIANCRAAKKEASGK